MLVTSGATEIGSPPQVRGKRILLGLGYHVVRITPAGAGKTVEDAETLPRSRDHPRRCGENVRHISDCSISVGSPPQVRGKLKATNIDGQTIRITPAGAGKTGYPRVSGKHRRDHPRRCGENFVPSLAHCGKVGSPPQVRGKRNPTYEDFGEDRITPAGAGKTLRQGLPTVRHRDHPRRCGENLTTQARTRINAGSPPQVRGKPSTCTRLANSTRITPAGAGKTQTRE